MSKETSSGCLAAVLRLFGVDLVQDGAGIDYPYQAKKFLLTRAEKSLFGVLQQAVGDDYLIFAKVRLADLLIVRKGTEGRQSFQNRINAKHIDFVLCNPQSVSPMVCIELDDSSHQRPDRIKRDEFVDKSMLRAKLALVRVRAQTSYRVQDIRAAIQAALLTNQVSN